MQMDVKEEARMEIKKPAIAGTLESSEKSTFPSPASTVTWQSLDSNVPAIAGFLISILASSLISICISICFVVFIIGFLPYRNTYGFFDHVSFEWKEDRVYMKRWVNMNSQALERPVVTAKICES